MKPLICVLLALGSLSACTTTHPTQPNSLAAYRLGRLGEKKPATLTLASGEHTRAHLVRVDGDTLRWFNVSTSTNYAVPLRDVAEVRFLRRGHGAWQGLRIGAAGGAVGGAIYGAATYQDDGCAGFIDVCSARGNAVSNGIVGAFNGVLYGALAGFIVGARDRYVFTPGTLVPPTRVAATPPGHPSP